MTTENPFTQGHTLWNEHQDFINSTARSIAYSYRSSRVEEEDVLQEIHLFLWEKEKHFLEGGFSAAYIRTSIKNVARNYALKVRDTALLETDRFFYSVEEVKELMPHFLLGDWANAPVPDGAATLTKNDNVEMMCDFSIAYDKLGESHKAILNRKYGAGEELSDQKDRQQASRAIKKFHLLLNATTDQRAKQHEGPGSRKAQSNAAGIYAAKEGAEG